MQQTLNNNTQLRGQYANTSNLERPIINHPPAPAPPEPLLTTIVLSAANYRFTAEYRVGGSLTIIL